MTDDYVEQLRRARAKLVEQRRGLVKRDCSSERNEGFGERIILLQNAIEATDRAISEETGYAEAAGAVPLVRSA